MDRKQKYKAKPGCTKKMRERRRHQSTELRRSKRQHVMNAKRVRMTSMCANEEDITVEEVQQMAALIVAKTGDKKEQLRFLKRSFTQGTALIDAFLSVDNAMAALVGILTRSDSDLQLDAAWCLTNIAAGLETHESTVLTHAGPYLVTYLSSGNPPLQDQCAWAIGNIAGGDTKHRDILRDQGAIQALINLLQSSTKNVVKSAAFALSNIAKDKEKCKTLVDEGVLPALVTHLKVSEDNMDVLAECAWVLTYIGATGEHEAALISGGILSALADIAVDVVAKDKDNFNVLTPVLRCLGNICSRPDDAPLKACENKQLMPTVAKLLDSTHRHIRKETLWALSNLTGHAEVCKLALEANLVKPLIEMLHSTQDIKHEVAYTMCNLAYHSTDICQHLLDSGALPAMVPLLKSTDTDTVHLALSFTDMVLRDTENGRQAFEEAQGLTFLEALEYHQNDTLRLQTNEILDNYFYKEADKRTG
ncbi:hypothetical protein CAPTEDRAFT_224969 [Capitella teleta]|uniref:Importin subunit alpha n=1 Tax=Capitella teleta TaxID=283909 RepID=R7UUE1_CAPTE|nr:hypothetical protein CAPTEDRAFT_224969 [Capitella teleta]|eukprot:ELU07006.1 hypothetical protein CAPTEDRAFT_224969 [Capitella teleta]